jgi:hypothetical protein
LLLGFDKAGEKGSGYFVIQVEFALRTMPGNPDPFIDMFHTVPDRTLNPQIAI